MDPETAWPKKAEKTFSFRGRKLLGVQEAGNIAVYGELSPWGGEEGGCVDAFSLVPLVS